MVAPAPERVVLVRMSALGDVALASVAVEALAGRSHTLLVTGPGLGALYADDPRLAGVIEVDPTDRETARASIRAFGPDVIVDLQGTTRSRRVRSGLDVGDLLVAPRDAVRRRLLLARLGALAPSPRPVLDRYRDVLEAVLGEPVTVAPRLHVGDAARASAAGVLGGDPWVGLAPGAAWANKRWPLDRFLELARALRRRTIGVAVVLGPDDGDEAASFAAAFDGDDGVRLLDEPLGRLPSLLSRLAVLVTGDSGPLHVAEAVGTPVVALFGPTVPGFGFAPWRVESEIVQRARWCRPCHLHGGHRCPLGHHRCLTEISSDEVLEVVLPRVGARPEASRPRHVTPGGTENGGYPTCHSGRDR